MFNNNRAIIALVILFLPSTFVTGYKNFAEHMKYDTKTYTTRYIGRSDQNSVNNKKSKIDYTKIYDDIAYQKLYDETTTVVGMAMLFTAVVLTIVIVSGMYDDDNEY